MRTVVLSLLAGMLVGNAFPHFVRGITHESYPGVIGRGPVPNVAVGSLGLALSGGLVSAAGVTRHPRAAWVSGSAGLLLLGLFHAAGGAERYTTAIVGSGAKA